MKSFFLFISIFFFSSHLFSQLYSRQNDSINIKKFEKLIVAKHKFDTLINIREFYPGSENCGAFIIISKNKIFGYCYNLSRNIYIKFDSSDIKTAQLLLNNGFANLDSFNLKKCDDCAVHRNWLIVAMSIKDSNTPSKIFLNLCCYGSKTDIKTKEYFYNYFYFSKRMSLLFNQIPKNRLRKFKS